MSRRTMQRFNTIKDQFMALINQPNADFKQIFDKWEADLSIQYIIRKMPDEMDKIMDIEYTKMDCTNMMDENSTYSGRCHIVATLLESYILFAVDKNMFDVVSFIFSRYAQYIRHIVYTECVFSALEDTHYKIFNYLTTDKNIIKHHKLNYVNLFITISKRIIFDFSSDECIGKSIRHIIRTLTRNSHKVPFSSFIDMVSYYTNLEIHTFRYMLKNVKEYVREPYDFNVENWGGFADERHNLFIQMVKRGDTNYAMIFADELNEYNIDIVHRNMENMYSHINYGFSSWGKITDVKFVEWYYFKTNKQFNIIDYVNSRATYEIFTSWYEWPLHMRQLLMLVRKHYGKKVAIDFSPYDGIHWGWFEGEDITPEDIPYFEKHCKYAKNLFSYGCIKMVDRVKEHATFLI